MTKALKFGIVIIGFLIQLQGVEGMRKFAVVFLLLLLSIITAVLFFQWKIYSNDVAIEEKAESDISQHLFVQSKSSKQIHIKQTIVGLSAGKTYPLSFSKHISEWTCMENDLKECQVDKNELSVEQEGSVFTFTYTLPFKKGTRSMLLNQWGITLERVPVQRTKVEIAESIRRKGVWIAGAPQVGEEQMDVIDYYVFEQSGGIFPIYWQNTKLAPFHLRKELSIYSEDGKGYQPKSDFSFMDDISHFYTTIIVTDKHGPVVNEKGLIITNEQLQGRLLDKTLASQYFLQRSPVQYEQWFYDFFAANLIGLEPETTKARNIQQQLNSALSDMDLATFFDRVKYNNEGITAEKLDRELFKLTDLKTTFFQQNCTGDAIVPLYFIDNKRVSVNGDKKEMKLLIHNKSRFYPFIETMERLGFTIEQFPDQILLTKGKVSIRFYKNKKIFILNQEDYGLLEKPLTEINGMVYMEQKWLKKIFGIHIKEENDQVILNVENE